ncbi:MAG TPA: hypothetical protein PL009_00485 [Flavipsychrobacter sp.]|nr:hypothetical protein [Flavipsychrobacter sp.]
MKKILIITPHYPPSNLAAVHRSRLFAQHLPEFGWEPIILTVHEDYYEETLDWNLHKLLPKGQRIEKVKAFSAIAGIGDLGLRALAHLYKRALQLIRNEEVEFLYIPIPSFYSALLGRLLHEKTDIKYGVDYIDPWVYELTGNESKHFKHWLTVKVAKFLEPIAVKKASLITGVAEGYYKGVQERNPHLIRQAVFGAMPYGGEKRDHEMLHELTLKPYLFEKKEGKIQLVYAGAMLPKAYQPLEAIFKAISDTKIAFEQLEIHFIGTGKSANDENGYNIKPLAEKYSLWQTIIFEYPKRIPYLDVLIHLDNADGVFILGSTEPHYTPSKTYQGVLSKKPILAVLHEQSSAVEILKFANVGVVLPFDGEAGLLIIEQTFMATWTQYQETLRLFTPQSVNMKSFEEYSARAVTKSLVNLLNQFTS